MERYMAHLLKGAEYRTRQFMGSQVKILPPCSTEGSKEISGRQSRRSMPWLLPWLCISMRTAAYKSKELYQAVDLALDFIARTQREDGSFDYPSCNFKSAADTSFCFKRLIAAYRLLVKYGNPADEAIRVLKEKYLTIMHKALDAIREGGFHTPNHRWGIAAALLQGSNLFAAEKEFAAGLKNRAEQYLAEGIDGDEDGEYVEVHGKL